MLHSSSKEASEIDSSIRSIFRQILQDSSELAASQTREWEQNRGVAVQLQSSLESMKGHDMVALLETVTSVHNQLVSCLRTIPEQLLISPSNLPMNSLSTCTLDKA